MNSTKIAIVLDDERAIASHFGRTRGFKIFEIEGEEIKRQEYRLNNFTGHARGLAGADHETDRHGPILTALQDCSVVIAHGMERRIYDDLKTFGIEVFITEETDVEAALERYLKGRLENRPELGCCHDHA
jgi:predicted Fe-Mo cluster-binding NifX family protein